MHLDKKYFLKKEKTRLQDSKIRKTLHSSTSINNRCIFILPIKLFKPYRSYANNISTMNKVYNQSESILNFMQQFFFVYIIFYIHHIHHILHNYLMMHQCIIRETHEQFFFRFFYILNILLEMISEPFVFFFFNFFSLYFFSCLKSRVKIKLEGI